MKSCLDKSFKYTKAVATDVRATFARVRKEARDKAKRDAEEREASFAKHKIASIERKRA